MTDWESNFIREVKNRIRDQAPKSATHYKVEFDAAPRQHGSDTSWYQSYRIEYYDYAAPGAWMLVKS